MKICILGHFGGNKDFFDGQTIKTKSLYDGLKKYTDNEVNKIDTYNWKKHPIKLLNNIKKSLKENDVFIMLPAYKGVQIFAPLICGLNKKYHCKIFYNVIGGWLPNLLEENPKLIKYMQKFNGIWVETSTMKKKLLKINIKSEILPNFKDLNASTIDKSLIINQNPQNFCTFSRVTQKKGISDAINAIVKINREANEIIAKLDIYGSIDPNYKSELYSLLDQYSEFIEYKGEVKPNESVSILEKYNALIFPTHYYTEGIPGTIIDAFYAKTPIISAKWENFDDLLNDKNSLSFNSKDVDALKERIVELINDRKLQLMLTTNSDNIFNYQPKSVMKTINNLIQ